jgi:hypothetical protein
MYNPILIFRFFLKVAGSDGKITLGDLMGPILLARDHAEERHREFVLTESTDELSQPGSLYLKLVEMVNSLSSEEVEWEREAEFFDFAIPSSSYPSALSQLFFKLRLCKDAVLGKLATCAFDNRDQSVSRDAFVRIVTATFKPLIPEISKAIHDTYSYPTASEEEVREGRQGFPVRLKHAFNAHIKGGGMEPLLGSLFDLLDVDSSGSLTLQEIIDARMVFHAGPSSLEERFIALISLFDADGDGEISSEEAKAILSKVLCIVRRAIVLLLDVLQQVVFEGSFDPMLENLWSKLFPEEEGKGEEHGRLTKKHAFEFLVDPEELMDATVFRDAAEDPLRLKALESAIKKCEDRPVELAELPLERSSAGAEDTEQDPVVW